ncbi:hypothetical protein HDE76_001248 [Rhodanobacter sp. ANJX3]|uniref:hypothetical protein n=1 Tax=unclassified Rhodanobacter TaxID=2621553 RepID=UPI0015CBA100|nr:MULTISPECIES: hypothetical protein [unclassified Rhodanobacter]MBB5358042.1 hypothetical protein [Rhodanobacter sp. ANJX3]NYE29689.1 hypothetical protein [Rhodanobacter sp. K2T2]
MQAIEQLQALLLGNFYGSFSVASAFGLDFDGFELSTQDVRSPDEKLIESSFVNSYGPAANTANPELIGKSAILAACLGAAISDVQLSPDASITLRFANGVKLQFPTDTTVVDWHWAITEDGQDPYSGCIIGCFAPGKIQSNPANKSFKADGCAAA